MIQLVYESKAQDRFSNSDLALLLDQARQRNAADDITGILIFHEDYFLQVLEGPEDNVQRCFDRIKNDERHGDIWMLARMKMHERAFSKWRMGLARITDMPPELHASLRDFIGVKVRMDEFRADDPKGEAAYTARIVSRFFAQFPGNSVSEMNAH